MDFKGIDTKGSPNFQPYTTRKDKLLEQLGCVLWGSWGVSRQKVGIPYFKWHIGHLGISGM